MLEPHFIGRKVELKKLHSVLNQAINLNGTTLVIEALTGMGTSTLLKEFENQIHKDPQLDNIIFINVECDKFSGIENAYYPFIKILESFKKGRIENKEIAKKAISIIKETAPDWLDVFPVIGPSIKAVVKTATKASDIVLSSGSNTQSDKKTLLIDEYVKAILRISSSYRVLILIISDAQWIDSASCHLLLHLAQIIREQEHKLVLILTYSSDVDGETPLNDLLSEMLKRKIAEKITLNGWTIEEIRTFLNVNFGELLNPNLAEWLRYLCNGQPWFITEYLSLLRENNIIELIDGKYKLNGQIKYEAGEFKVEGRLNDILPSRNVDDVFKARIKNLQTEDRQILQIGAIQGKRFMSAVLERILSKQKHEIITRLLQIEERLRLISCCTDDESIQMRSDAYVFTLNLMQESIYNGLPPAYRRDSHCEIARVLEDILDNALTKNSQAISQRKLMIQIARHYDYGDEPLLAASYYFKSAKSTFYNGALKETSELCEAGLDKIRSLPENIIDYDKLHAEIIQLKLTASEMWWHGKPESSPIKSEEESLVEEAEAAAFRAGERSLIIRLKYLKGKIYITTYNLDGAIEALKEALQMAKEDKDSLAEFFIMAELGHRIIGSSTNNGDKTLDIGLRLQYEAYSLLKYYLKSQLKSDIMVNLDPHLYRLKMHIGVGEFDRGNFGESIKWLVENVKELREKNRIEEFSWSLNYLGQVYTAIGLFNDAENLFKEAIGLHKDEEPVAIRGYNLALLGKLYLEWGRVKDATKPLVEGWNETKLASMIAIVPLVRNHYTELLIHPDYKDNDLGLAEKQIRDTIKDSERTRFHRSKIIALWLWGKLDLMQGHIYSAAKHSTEAVHYIEEMGITPPIRLEEIFYDHYRILKAIPDRQIDAKYYLTKAYTILQNKADSLKNEEYKYSFLHLVPISRAILSAFNS
jgi:tetratricopeptide (TPR) repeat protein